MPSDNIVKYINELAKAGFFKERLIEPKDSIHQPIRLLDGMFLNNLCKKYYESKSENFPIAKDTDDILYGIRRDTNRQYWDESKRAPDVRANTIQKSYGSFIQLAMRDILDSKGELREPIKSALSYGLQLKDDEWRVIKFAILKEYLDFLINYQSTYEQPYSSVAALHNNTLGANEKKSLEDIYALLINTYCEQAEDRESLEKLARECEECKQCYANCSYEYGLFNDMSEIANQWIDKPAERMNQLRGLFTGNEGSRNKTILNNAKNHPIAGSIVKGIILFLTGIGIPFAIQEWRHVDRLRKSAQHAKSIEDKFVEHTSKSSSSPRGGGSKT